MDYIFKGSKVHYEIFGNGDKEVVFLHGWGGSINSFSFISKDLNFSYKALFVDFPPFGDSEEPKETLTIFDYADMVQQIMEREGFKRPLMVGHSFGGRVAIILANKNLADGLILTASAGMKVRHGIKYYYKIYKHKLCKRFGLKSSGGSSDYKMLSQNMKKTFINIVNTNLEKYAINIGVPCVLVWGKKDKDTPFYMAKKLNKLIKESEIIAYKHCGHFCYLEKYAEFVAIINSFSKSNNIQVK